MLYQRLLGDASFFALLLRYDEDLAGAERALGCPCGGRLHRADYRRKPRGGPPGMSREQEVRLSLCCARDGCRRRCTPASLRFLGRRVFYGVLVLLLPALRDGPTPMRVERLCEVFAVSQRTLLRWRRWWHEVFAQSPQWRVRRSLLASPPSAERLPAGLLSLFAGGSSTAAAVVAVLCWLLPWSSSSARLDHAVSGW